MQLRLEAPVSECATLRFVRSRSTSSSTHYLGSSNYRTNNETAVSRRRGYIDKPGGILKLVRVVVLDLST